MLGEPRRYWRIPGDTGRYDKFNYEMLSIKKWF
jgi:hypothetical protein